jgi:hypothetical protein
VSPVKYELGFHIPEDDIFHSQQSSPSRQGEKVAGPGQSSSLGPAWELQEAARVRVISPCIEDKENMEYSTAPALLPRLKPNGANVR